MRATKQTEIREQEPEELDAATLAAIDKAERYEPGKGINFDEALQRARARHEAWQNVPLDQTA
jgi:hypothetical protein